MVGWPLIGGADDQCPCRNAADPAAFRSLIERRRCLIPADGFYEWETSASGQRQPYDFKLARGELFAFAGLYTGWHDRTRDDPVLSCTIITTRPNTLVASLHDRMPVILRRETHNEWLDPAISAEHALALLEPYPAEMMGKAAVSPLVNSVRNDGPELLEPSKQPAPLFHDAEA